jgi:hypothetical protein
MAISNDLFMAVLAMDSYNRGYNAGIDVSGSQLGSATLSGNADDAEGLARAASFFAQSYQLADGNTVISYRGTDQPGLDIENGYKTGRGIIVDTEATIGERLSRRRARA